MGINRRIKEAVVSSPILLLGSWFASIMSISTMMSSGNLDDDHVCIVLLPLAVFLGTFTLLLTGNAGKLKIGSLCTYAFYVFRFTLVATFSVLGNYYIETSPSLYLSRFNLACIMMFVEYLAVIHVMCVMNKKNNHRNSDNYFRENNLQWVKLLLLVGTVFCLGAVILFPALKSNFFLFFGSTENRLLQKASYAQASSSVPGIVFYPFVFLVEWLRVSLPIYICTTIVNSNKGKIVKAFVVIAIIILSAIVTTHVQITSWFVIIIIMLFVMERRPVLKRIIWVPAAFISVYIFVKAMDDYSGLGNSWMISRVLQDYFNGPSNIAAGISMPREHVFSKFFIDIVYSNNLLGGLFGVGITDTSTDMFFRYTNDYTRSSIFPFLGQASYYFGFILAPFLSALCMYCIGCLENKAYRIESETYRLLLLFCCFKLAACLSMYFMYTSYAVYFDFVIPYYFLAWLGTRVRLIVRKKR